MRQSIRATRLLATAAVTTLVLSFATAVRADRKPEPAEASLATMVVSVEAAPTERMLDGMVEAVNQSTVSAQTAGRVAAIYFDVNDVVPAGALIIRIRSTVERC